MIAMLRQKPQERLIFQHLRGACECRQVLGECFAGVAGDKQFQYLIDGQRLGVLLFDEEVDPKE